MGCDIHVAVEQAHPDGGWETVMHDMEGWAGILRPAKNHIEAFGARDYRFFGLLRGVRENEDGPWLATEGLPDDASAFARDKLEYPGEDPEMQHWVSVSGDMHSHGWITYDDLLGAALDAAALPQTLVDPELHKVLTSKVRMLQAALEGAEPTLIYRGHYWDPDTDTYHPDMGNLSAHERLVLSYRAGELLPVSGHSVRLLFAFDN